MHKITLQRPVAIIVHPNDSDLRFEVMRPTPAEAAEFSDSLRVHERYEVAIHPETKDVIRDKNGRVEYITLPPIYPKSIIGDFLGRYVKNIWGMVDEDGRPVNFHNNKDAVIDALIAPELTVTEPDPDKPNGTRMLMCVQWLVTKLNDPETFRPHPARTVSSAPSPEDLEKLEKNATPVS